MSYIGSKEFEEAYSRSALEDFATPIVDRMIELKYNPVVYNNEPYQPEETINDILKNYLEALDVLRKKYLDTKDIELASLIYHLLPTAIYDEM